MVRTVLVLVVAAQLVACGQKSKSSDSGGQFPKRVEGEGDATAAQQVGVAKAGTAISVDLSRAPHPGETAAAACYAMPVSGTVLGQAVCESDSNIKVELTAEHVTLRCNGSAMQAPSVALDLNACASYRVLAYAFEPRLIWDVDNGEGLQDLPAEK